MRVWSRGLWLVLFGCALGVGGCGRQSMRDPRSRPAREIAMLWWWMLVAACVVFAGALGLLGMAWVRRRREGVPLVGTSSRRNFALVLTFGFGIPIVVNVVLFVVADFVVIKDTAAPAVASTSMTIDVIGRQWFWEVRYPGTSAVTANEIHIPVRTRVNVVATSGDVIHSFWVPQLNRKIDMIPGRRNRELLYADRVGRYRGQCAEFCGVEHAQMAIYVDAQSPRDFARWLQREAAPRVAPASVAERAGAKEFFADQCASCHAIRGTSARGEVGPDLTHVGSRATLAALTLPNDARALGEWLSDPQHVKPGNRMPDLGLSQPQVRRLVAYLEGLR